MVCTGRTLGANWTAPAIRKRLLGTLFAVAFDEASRMRDLLPLINQTQKPQRLLTIAPVSSFVAEGGPGIQGTRYLIEKTHCLAVCLRYPNLIAGKRLRLRREGGFCSIS